MQKFCFEGNKYFDKFLVPQSGELDFVLESSF